MIKQKAFSIRNDSNERIRNEKIEEKIHKERNAAIDFLAREIFHEIRNPLTIIKCNAQFCLKYCSGHQDLKDSLRAIIDNVNVANKFAEDMLNLTRIKLRPKLIQINDVIKKTIDLLNTDLNHKDIRVDIDLRPVPRSYMDETKIKEVFVNLILNAIHALKKNGAIAISSLFERETNRIIIHIKDNGKGMPKRYIIKAFEPLFPLSKSKRVKGLGLVICRNIIDLHNGNIYAENIEDGGTMITIQLPLKRYSAIE